MVHSYGGLTHTYVFTNIAWLFLKQAQLKITQCITSLLTTTIHLYGRTDAYGTYSLIPYDYKWLLQTQLTSYKYTWQVWYISTKKWLIIIGVDSIHTINMHTCLYNVWEHDDKYVQQGTTSNKFRQRYQRRQPCILIQ